MGCPNGQDIVVGGTSGPTNLAPGLAGVQPERYRKEGAMLSTTVEPECRQLPFVISYAMTGPRSGVAANTVGHGDRGVDAGDASDAAGRGLGRTGPFDP